MKNKFFKIIGLVLSFGMAISNLPSVSAGGVFSMLKKPTLTMTPEERHRIAMGILRGTPKIPASMNIPTQASDGGMAYFWAWNGVIYRNSFDAFIEKYDKDISDYTTSARSLPDSLQDENWQTAMCTHEDEVGTLEFFEESKDPDPSKYLLRIFRVRNVAYTIRKSGNLYLVTFYLATTNTHNTNDSEPKLRKSCTFVSSDIRNIEYLLLPIDSDLLY